MDNLTHSMIGALLGQAGLKRKSGLGMPTAIIAANIPDIDASCTVFGTLSLAMRRGLTHGPVAMLVLPALLTGIMVAYDRWQGRRGRRPDGRAPVNPGWLFVIALIGTLSHPAMDWMNSYGVRLLSPFSDRWFYGDTLFIIDLWLWIGLIGGFIWSRRAEKRNDVTWIGRARIVCTVACVYIFANGVITGVAEAAARDAYLAAKGQAPEMVVANPLPVAFWRREILWRGGGHYGSAGFDLLGAPMLGRLADAGATGMDDPAIAAAKQHDARARAFLFWSRMPTVRRRDDGAMVIGDQRFVGRGLGQFTIIVPAQALKP